MEVRSFEHGDAGPLGEVMFEAVRGGARRRYSDEQVAAWMPHVPDGERWRARLEASDTIVAVEGDRRLGFMTVDAKGYVDLAFVLPDAMGTGVSDAIYAVLEGRARARGIETLSSQASLLAEPFFTRQGWQLVRRQEVEMAGVILQNAWMEKHLSGDIA